MIEMVLAGADKRDLVKMIDKKVVKRQEAILNVVETGDNCEDVVEYPMTPHCTTCLDNWNGFFLELIRV